MGPDLTVQQLKNQLLVEVESFYKRDNRLWKKPIVTTLRDLKADNVQAVLFGGTLRSLLLGRVFRGIPGRPRDVDVVVSGISLEALKEQFEDVLVRETRFGGLQLRPGGFQFDIWPLQQTWAFVRDPAQKPAFECLPATTFFNLEAIAVEVWAKRGHSRLIFSGDDQFFNGILTRTLEVNREENPFPHLCVVRALVMSAAINFKIGPHLARYITNHGLSMTLDDLEEVQLKHYGQQQAFPHTLQRWIEFIANAHSRDDKASFMLPRPCQLKLWSDFDDLRCTRPDKLRFCHLLVPHDKRSIEKQAAIKFWNSELGLKASQNGAVATLRPPKSLSLDL